MTNQTESIQGKVRYSDSYENKEYVIPDVQTRSQVHLLPHQAAVLKDCVSQL